MSKKAEKLKQCVFFSNFSNNTQLARPTLSRFTGSFLYVDGIVILYKWRMWQLKLSFGQQTPALKGKNLAPAAN